MIPIHHSDINDAAKIARSYLSEKESVQILKNERVLLLKSDLHKTNKSKKFLLILKKLANCLLDISILEAKYDAFDNQSIVWTNGNNGPLFEAL